MKRITLTVVFAAAAAAAGAQTPPVPPVPPAAPVPAPAPTPHVAPVAPLPPQDLDLHVPRAVTIDPLWDRADIEASRAAVEAMRASQRAAAEANREALREASRISIDATLAAADVARQQARIATDRMRDFGPLAPLALQTAVSGIAPITRFSDDFRRAYPVWIQGDPADSAYRLAHEALNRGDYGRAAQMFRDVAQRYPKSAYQNDLPYYEAYARYKIGTTDELHSAAKLLEPRASKLIGAPAPSAAGRNMVYAGFRRGTSDGDVLGLYIRVNSTLAQRGDRAAADVVAKAAQSGANTCDRDDMQVRIEALNALSQMDAAAALPQMRRVLDQKDECTAELRRSAVFILGRRGDADAASLLASVARSDPSVSVRAAAISWLPKLQGDAGVNALEEMLRTEQDENIQRAVVRTLVSSDNPKARASMRTLIDRKDAPVNLRVEAISSFNGDRVTSDDVAYLKSLYSRADNDRIKDAIIGAIARIGGSENDQWVLNIAKSQNESSQIRASAISRLMRSNISIADLMKLYDASDSYGMRQQIVSQLDRRNEPEAADKLYEIAKNSTVNNIRMQAFNALLRKKDPRTVQLAQEIIEGKRP